LAQIIAARFETQAQADSALGALRAVGVSPADSTTFYLNAPGQHAEYPIGGDAHHDEGTKHAGAQAKAVAAVGGAAGLALGAATAAALGEPALTAAGAIAGAGVGGYVGALAGGLTGSRGGKPENATTEEPVERHGGVMVAVQLGSGVTEDDIVRVMRTQGALHTERAQGELRDGEWVDFDARRPPDYIDPPAAAR
jgi:hypothetical protein